MGRGHPPGRDYMRPGARVHGRDYMLPPQNGDSVALDADPRATTNGDAPATANGGEAVVSALPAGGAVVAAGVTAAPATASNGAAVGVTALRRRRRVSLAAPFEAFRLRDFRYLTLSTVAVGFGQWAQQIGIFWLIWQITESPVQLGALGAVRGLVGTVVAPFGGLLAEKYPRRDVMIWSTLAGAVQAAGLAALVVTDTVDIWHVYAFALIAGTTMSINQPTRHALVYDVTTDELLPNAVAMNSAAQNISRVAGPPLAGALIGFFGVGSAFIFIVVVRTLAMGLTLQISRATRQERLRGGRGALGSMAEGFRYSWQDKRILGLIVVGAIPSLFVYPYIAFLPVISEDVLGRGAQGFGLLASMLGWGSILGLFILAYGGRRLARGWVMLTCFVVYTLLLTAFASSTVYVLSLSLLAVAGIFHAIAMALNNTLLQLAVRNDLRGRVMSVWQMSHGLQPLGSLPMGMLIASQGTQIGLGSFMVFATIAFLVMAALWGSVRRM